MVCSQFIGLTVMIGITLPLLVTDAIAAVVVPPQESIAGVATLLGYRQSLLPLQAARVVVRRRAGNDDNNNGVQ